MDHKQVIQELKRNHQVFRELLTGLERSTYTWKKSEDKWSILEIVCHLRDIEVADFRQRLQITIEAPGTQPPSIFPEAWVKERNYHNQNFAETLTEFLSMRQASIEYLEKLDLQNINWDNAYQHETLGTLSADLFLRNWLAHDYLHIKQITKSKYDYLEETGVPNLGYAGTWT